MKNGRIFRKGEVNIMKRATRFLALSVAIVALSIANVSARGSSDNKPSKTMEQQILKKLIGLPHYGVFDHITFEINQGTVTLGGKVISLGTKSSAAAVVKEIPGVSKVINNIEELPPSPFDDTIRRDTLRAFADKGLYRYLWAPNPSVRIIVDRGHVTLEGYVANKTDYNLMNITANGISGVFSVQNNLIVGDSEYR